ncbi:aminoglycoside 3-N-acetyltransferase [Actinomycetospora atypica]|uniref:Aminoglycoside N(3)-acetyltransferase n=1 Tax=Actinomycetospora atypica TaxID=1290095 RepID=A0ABV9YG31_9PSEU
MFRTTADLAGDLRALGLGPGDAVMVHGAMRRVGPMLDGPDTLIDALLDVVAPGGTVLAYTDWEAPYVELLDADGRCPAPWRDHVRGFDPASSRSAREYGALPEFVRTRPGARRSGSPGASVAALGADAAGFTDDHPLDYGYGPGSPLARLVEHGGKVAMIGAPRDTLTLLHHAEHLADLPDKRVISYEVPFATTAGVRWRPVEEFDTAEAVHESFDEDFFGRIVEEFVATGGGREGPVGGAPTLVVDAAPLCAFAVAWMEAAVPRP